MLKHITMMCMVQLYRMMLPLITWKMFVYREMLRHITIMLGYKWRCNTSLKRCLFTKCCWGTSLLCWTTSDDATHHSIDVCLLNGARAHHYDVHGAAIQNYATIHYLNDVRLQSDARAHHYDVELQMMQHITRININLTWWDGCYKARCAVK